MNWNMLYNVPTPMPWRIDLYTKFKPGYSKLVAFMLWFVKPVIISEKVTEQTTNYYVYKWLFGNIYLVDEYGITTFN